MSSIQQYFDTDFEQALCVYIRLRRITTPCVGALLYDATASVSFLSFYFNDSTLQPTQFKEFLSSLQPGKTEVEVQGGIRLPSVRLFPGALKVHNSNPLRIEYQFFGDPSPRDLLGVKGSGRVFIYAETSFSASQISELHAAASGFGLELQFRDTAYARERTIREKPLAFIIHDSRDKDEIARPIALNLQRKVCPVWYDEFSLRLGANLREAIERGLKECEKCVLILSLNFLTNQGWGKKEFESVFTREILENSSLFLPIWCGVTKQQVYDYCASLVNVKGIEWALGENEVCRRIYGAVTGPT